MQRMMECVDGDYQTFKSQSGAYVREHFFGKYPELLELVADLSDDEIWALHRGGHDPQGVRRLPSGGAYPGQADGGAGQNRQRVWHGEAGEGQNINHQLKNEPGCGESLPRPFRADHLRRPTGRDPLPEARTRQRGGEVHHRDAHRAGRLHPCPLRPIRSAGDTGTIALRRPPEGQRRTQHVDHHGFR